MEVRKSFHQHLEDLYLDLLKMANITVDTIEKARNAFSRLDRDLAQEVIDADDVVDDYIIKIQENGIEMLARQAPVAIDLRMIIVIMRLATHLERIADNCVNICKVIISLEGRTLSPWILENMDEMFQGAIRMVAFAVDSFKERDEGKAEGLYKMDDAVDQINRRFLTSTDKESEEEVDLVIRVVMISRFVERVADHAVDIGEEVRYMITGHFVT